MQEILNQLENIKNYVEKQDQTIKQQQNQLDSSISILDEQHYWNTHQDKLIYDKSIVLIDECIKVASKYGGRVFGGYVRNQLIPKFYNQYLPGFKDVDLWFTSSSKALTFTLEMANRLVYKSTSGIKADQIEYPFGRTQFMLRDEDNNVVIVDVIVSDELPVNDLNVNQLTYSSIESYKSFGKDDTMTLMKSIKDKTASRLPGYSKSEFKKANKNWNFQQERLQKLKSLNWEIIELHKQNKHSEPRDQYSSDEDCGPSIDFNKRTDIRNQNTKQCGL